MTGGTLGKSEISCTLCGFNSEGENTVRNYSFLAVACKIFVRWRVKIMSTWTLSS